MTSWVLLARELDEWQACGRRATLWWRDDDAVRDCDALARLFAIAREQRVSVAIAAIPATCDASLVSAVGLCPEATVLQHGYAHANHAQAGERSAEFGTGRSLGARRDELARGRARLAECFGQRFAPVFVPPWNRYGADVVAMLPAIGLSGLSAFDARSSAQPAPGVVQVNAHVDPIAWRRGRTFIGAQPAIGRVVAHLRARRTGEADTLEPTGLLTHHLAFDDAAFGFLAELVARTREHPAVTWLDARQAFELDDAITSARSA